MERLNTGNSLLDGSKFNTWIRFIIQFGKVFVALALVFNLRKLFFYDFLKIKCIAALKFYDVNSIRKT